MKVLIIESFEELKKIFDNNDAKQQPIAIEQKNDNYENHHRKKVLNNLVKHIRSKRISMQTVAAWSDKNENYIRAQIPHRTERYVNTFWAVDVVKFLCDVWAIDYPNEYFIQCQKFGIAA